jgi:thioredoxin reductase (NADPH)
MTDAMPMSAESLEETVDLHGAFPQLSDGQIAMLLGRGGDRRTTMVGDVLYRAGDRPYDFVVVLEGKVAVVEGYQSPNERVVGVHGRRRFLGEISLLTGQAAFVTAVVVEAGEVLVVPVEPLRELVLEDVALSDLILRAYLQRRSILIEVGVGFRILGSCYSPDTRRLREFAARNRLPHRFVDLDQDAGAESLLRQLGIPPEETPVVVWVNGGVLRNPSNAELARVIGLPMSEPKGQTYDLVIVGGGPAGLAAAVYGASEGLATMLLDSVAAGGQAGLSARIENYLGFPAGLSGAELAERAVFQAEKFRAALSIPAEAVSLGSEEGYHSVRLSDGSSVTARAVVIATGVRYRRLAVPDLDRFEGTSVYYAATLVEAHLCVGEPVIVVGGGNSAGQAAVFLAARASQVRMVVRDSDLTKTMSRYLIDRLERTPRIEIVLNSEVRALDGDRVLQQIEVENRVTGECRWFDARAVFVFIGAVPHTGWLAEAVGLDENGFVLAGPEAVAASTHRDRGSSQRVLSFETTRAGVFAVGDVRSGSVKRVASAVGEGSMVVRLIHEYLDEIVGPNDDRGVRFNRSSRSLTSSPS